MFRPSSYLRVCNYKQSIRKSMHTFISLTQKLNDLKMIYIFLKINYIINYIFSKNVKVDDPNL